MLPLDTERVFRIIFLLKTNSSRIDSLNYMLKYL